MDMAARLTYVNMQQWDGGCHEVVNVLDDSWWGSVGLQVDPGFSQLTPRLLSGTLSRNFQRLKVEDDKLLINVAFNCNLRRYIVGAILRW